MPTNLTPDVQEPLTGTFENPGGERETPDQPETQQGQPTIEYTEDDGTVVRLTPEQAAARLKTYSGKARSFDEASRKAAEAERRAKELEQTAGTVTEQRKWVAAIKDRSLPVEDRVAAATKFGQAIGAEEADIAATVAQIRAEGQTAPQSAGSSGLTPNQIARFEKAAQFIERAERAGFDPLDAIAEGRDFRNSTTEAWNKQAARQYILDNDPIFAKMVQDADSGSTVFDRIWNSAKGSGKPIGPEALQTALKQERALLEAYERTAPKRASAFGPSSLGGAPGSTGSMSRLTPPKMPTLQQHTKGGRPNIAEYAMALSEFNEYGTAQ